MPTTTTTTTTSTSPPPTTLPPTTTTSSTTSTLPPTSSTITTTSSSSSTSTSSTTTTLPHFPFCVDPFGNTVEGHGIQSTADVIKGSWFLRTVPCALWCIIVLLNVDTDTRHRCAVYDAGFNLLGQTDQRIINTGGVAQWEVFCFPSPVNLPWIPDQYLLTVWAENGGGFQVVYFIPDHENGETYQNLVYNPAGYPNPLVPTGVEDRLLCIYGCCGDCGGNCVSTTTMVTTTKTSTSTTTYTLTTTIRTTTITTVTTTMTAAPTTTGTTLTPPPTFTTPPPLEKNKILLVDSVDKNYYEFHYVKNHPDDEPDTFDARIPYDATINFFDKVEFIKDGAHQFVGFIEKIEPTVSGTGREMYISGRCWKVLLWKKWNERYQESREVGVGGESGFFGRVYPFELVRFLLRCPISIHPANYIRQKIGWGIPSDDWDALASGTETGHLPAWTFLRYSGFSWRDDSWQLRNRFYQIDLGDCYDGVTGVLIESRNNAFHDCFARNYRIDVCGHAGYIKVITKRGNNARDILHTWTPMDDVRYVRIMILDDCPPYEWEISQVYVFQADEQEYRLLDNNVYDDLEGVDTQGLTESDGGILGYTDNYPAAPALPPNAIGWMNVGPMVIIGPFYVPVTGTLGTVRVYCSVSDPLGDNLTNLRGVIYKVPWIDVYAVPNELVLVATGNIISQGDGLGWVDLTFATPPACTAGDCIYIGVCVEAGHGITLYRYTGWTGDYARNEYYRTAINCTPPDPFGAPSGSDTGYNDQWLIWTEYSGVRDIPITPINLPYSRISDAMGNICRKTLDIPTSYQPWEWWVQYDGVFRFAENRGLIKNWITLQSGEAFGKTTRSRSIGESAERIKILGRGEGGDQDEIISDWQTNTAAMFSMNTFYEKIISETEVSAKSDADIMAHVYLAELAEIFEQIDIKIEDDPYVGGSWDVGDTVNIIDAGTGLSGMYRIYRIEQRVTREGGEDIFITVGKSWKDIEDRLAELRKLVDKMSLSGTAVDKFLGEGARQSGLDPADVEEVWSITASNKDFTETPEDEDDEHWRFQQYPNGAAMGAGEGDYSAESQEFSIEAGDIWWWWHNGCDVQNQIYLYLYQNLTSLSKHPRFKCEMQIEVSGQGGSPTWEYDHFDNGDSVHVLIANAYPLTSIFSRHFGFLIMRHAGVYRLYCLFRHSNILSTNINVTPDVHGGSGINVNERISLEARCDYEERIIKYYYGDPSREHSLIAIIPFPRAMGDISGLVPCFIHLFVDNIVEPCQRCMVLFYNWKTEALT